jgi:hypothetical protein
MCINLFENIVVSSYLIMILKNDMGIRFDQRFSCLNLTFHYFLVAVRFCITIFITFYIIPIILCLYYLSFFSLNKNSELYKNALIYDQSDNFNLVYCWIFWSLNILMPTFSICIFVCVISIFSGNI